VDSTDHSSRDKTDDRASLERIACHDEYDDPLSADHQPVTDQGSEMFLSRMHEREDARSRKNPRDISNDRTPVAGDEPASESTTEITTGTYPQEGGGACSDDRVYTDPNLDACMTEQNYNDRYKYEYDTSRYQEERCVNDERFREITPEQSENDRTIPDTAKSDH